jgi:ABC-type multidrug transport system fused ATPase/permease subunit
LVLKGLNLKIEGGSKVGIVGRTGAGKSTMSLALSRIVEIEKGSIMIDGVNTKSVPLDKLR